MECGISLYLSSGADFASKIVEKASLAGIHYAFTSLQIPEEDGIDDAAGAKKLLALCRDHNIKLICDISPATLAKLGCRDYFELRRLGIEYVRLDDGFDARQTVELSGSFHVVFNASTITEEDIAAWRRAGADFMRFSACHNFYPKPLTGLSIDYVAAVNRRLKDLGFKTMVFVPGDETLRGPLMQGLPTVEAHRGDTGDELVCDMLELGSVATDIVLIGDPNVSDHVWQRIGELSCGYVSLGCEVEEPFHYIFDRAQHDRPDSSPWVLRSQESRCWKDVPEAPEADRHGEVQVQPGDILMSTKAYGRYAGELEIARQSFALDARDRIIGHIAESDRVFLPYLVRGAGFRLRNVRRSL